VRVSNGTAIGVAIAAIGLVGGVTAGAVATSSTADDSASQQTTSDAIPNLGKVKERIKEYYGDDGSGVASPTSDYAKEVHGLETQTGTRIPQLIAQADDDAAIVLDVDDTTLLTYDYEVAYDFGYDPVENADYIHNHGMGPVFGMPELANMAADEGATVYYLTGRSESLREDTLRDLDKAGYPNVASDHLYMRNKNNPPDYLPCEPDCTAVQYKSLTREHIESLGYDIVLNMGDQYSDLKGGFSDDRVKLPNPMYYLP
jgi:hypothetical protein